MYDNKPEDLVKYFEDCEVYLRSWHHHNRCMSNLSWGIRAIETFLHSLEATTLVAEWLPCLFTGDGINRSVIKV